MSTAGGTPFDWFFDALTSRMGILHTTEGHASQRDRVIWERSGALEPGNIKYTRPGEKTIGKLGHPWTASVYGASDLEVCARVAELWGHIDEVVGPPQGTGEVADHHGYTLKPGKVEPRGGDGVAAGYGCDVAVTLYTPVASQIRPLAAVTSVSVTATAPAGGGASEPGSLTWSSEVP